MHLFFQSQRLLMKFQLYTSRPVIKFFKNTFHLDNEHNFSNAGIFIPIPTVCDIT